MSFSETWRIGGPTRLARRPRAESARMREFDALNASLLIDSYELEGRVLGSDVVRDMTGSIEPLGVEPVGGLPGPLQYLLTRTPVDTPARAVRARDRVPRLGTPSRTLRDSEANCCCELEAPSHP